MKRFNKPMLKNVSLPALGTMTLLCLAPVTSLGRTPQGPDVIGNGLERVQGSEVQFAYLRPGTDLKKYKSVHIQRLVIPTTVRDTKPKGERPRIGESYLLRDEDVEGIQKLYDDAFRSVFSRAGFSVVDTADAGTLVIATEVTDITMKAPLEHTRGGSSHVRTYSEGGGSISIKAALADGGTEEVIAAVADSRYLNDLWRRNTRVQNIADLRRGFTSWARALANRVGGAS
jgi:hypothetical protein